MIEKIRAIIEENARVKELLLKDEVETIERIAKAVTASLRKDGKLLIFGNGGSAADSQHIAAEFVGRFRRERRPLAAIALNTNTSTMTALANDYGYEFTFSRQVEALGREGDIVMGLSTSGNSKNVLLGIKKAKEKGLYTIGFSGRDGGELKSLVDLSFVVPSQKTARVQEAHIMIGHIICERVDELL